MKTTQPTPVTLARLRAAMEKHGVAQRAVAEAAGVTRTHVCHVFARRAVSARVVATAKRLVAEAKARTQSEAVAS